MWCGYSKCTPNVQTKLNFLTSTNLLILALVYIQAQASYIGDCTARSKWSASAMQTNERFASPLTGPLVFGTLLLMRVVHQEVEDAIQYTIQYTAYVFVRWIDQCLLCTWLLRFGASVKSNNSSNLDHRSLDLKNIFQTCQKFLTIRYCLYLFRNRILR